MATLGSFKGRIAGENRRAPTEQEIWDAGVREGLDRAPVAQPDRHVLQAEGKHPAPCARYCEAKAFEIEIRQLKAQFTAAPAEPTPFPNEHRGFWTKERAIDNTEGNWPEDFTHENGNYECICSACRKSFIGHKRRICCKQCAAPSAVSIITSSQKENEISPSPKGEIEN